MQPLVSIVIPVFNGSDYLRDAIESALGQTYRNIEVIVVNDGSTDGGATEVIALSYGERIRHFWKPNGHVASALNFGIARMSGDYFSWLSHDDMYHPDKVETQVRALERLGLRTVVYGDFETLDVATGAIRPMWLPDTPSEHFRWFLTANNSLHGCTLLVPRVCFDECGPFNEKLRTTQDYDMWFRIAGHFPFVHVPGIGVRSRLHPGQGSNQLRGIAMEECDTLLAGFVRDLTEEELRGATGESAARSYAVLAANLQARGFPRARDAALELAQVRLAGAPLAAALATRLAIAGQVRLGSGAQRLKRLGMALVQRSRRRFGELADLAPLSRSVKRKFSAIYRRNAFGGTESRSGEGASIGQTATIRRQIPLLLGELGVRTMLDAACGDFNWMRHTALPVDLYIGIDIVDEVIGEVARRHGNSSRRFLCLDIIHDPLPRTDLILCRDCLVHLNFADAKRALSNFKRSGARYLLTTTFANRDTNVDLKGADVWRPLNLERPPFNVPKPLRIINEGCTEHGGAFGDKSLGLWSLQDLNID